MQISTIALAGVFVAISSLSMAETGAPSGQGSPTGRSGRQFSKC
jgi:hypothetical protein